MTNSANDKDEYLASIPFEWLFCRGWGHDVDKPSVRRRKLRTGGFLERLRGHARATHCVKFHCHNGCGYYVRQLFYVSPRLKKFEELDPEVRYDNPDYNVRGFRVTRAEAREFLLRHELDRVTTTLSEAGRSRELSAVG
ncbi:hypothetical protein [Amycolatopsis sp. NPDC004079]|uniref:hypothetical protein n=1 Tax=Amycolatopsis sp. NPDC004079 TaxID=3154549 RepID=UPI0033B4038F